MSVLKHLSVADFNKSLPAETAEVVKVVRLENQTTTKIFFNKFGTVDFKTLQVETAKILVRKGFPYLELKQKKQDKETAK